MLKKVLLLVLVLCAVLAVLIARQPDEFRIERTATIKAPASAVFEQVNDVRKFNDWSPWAKMDPEAKMTFSGPAAGVGATTHWSGKKTGEGKSTIVESKQDELVRFKLDFVKPFKATSMADLTFKTEGDQTVVTWSTYGSNNFLAKTVGLFMNCEKMVGGQLDQGLTNLKAVVEKGA